MLNIRSCLDWEHIRNPELSSRRDNITIGCWKYVETYVFTLEWMGEYKVVVMFTVDSETYNFTSEE